MDIPTKKLTDEELALLLEFRESHFLDFKSSEISPASLTKTVSALCNTSGGEIFIGLEEVETTDGPSLEWSGFATEEDANAHLDTVEKLSPLGKHYSAEFLSHEGQPGLVLHLLAKKVKNIVFASSGKPYVRRSAQNLALNDAAALRQLEYDKGIVSFEDEKLDYKLDRITNSTIIIDFLLSVFPSAEPEEFLDKQEIIVEGAPTVAATLLFHELPQAPLAKRSSIKILRYKTKNDEGERDTLAFDPLTVEGPAYNLIYEAVEKTKSLVEEIKKVTPDGLVSISYPHEALHEIVTNAVLHRDYSIQTDVQIRIFDNRIEIESPGRLPGHVTVERITKTQAARNPKMVRLINKFKNPPNKDAGEGMKTAFESMHKLRLKRPEIVEKEDSLVVILRHEPLGSPEQLVMEYLNKPGQSEITNAIARELTGIRSENTMKEVFYKLADANQIERVPGKQGNKAAWQKKSVA
ncbi:ATP-dependent DNA helicase RecG [Xanthomonas cannabis pv. phaseoli]|uniref:ATP-dependent DNA helicase RecG n=2 Tax=Xanthomonas TaxID=338 RepID=A0AB34PCV1_9XANT|nr:ATP-binding protein [Xanthomonas cannabis]KGK59387.1 ATP-dependent DNA helicase RecG [Xanthomonas cannabis pv. phaseoli]